MQHVLMKGANKEAHKVDEKQIQPETKQKHRKQFEKKKTL